MGGHVAGAQQGLPLRGGRRQSGVDIYTPLIDLLCHIQRAHGLICINGDDGGGDCACRLPDLQSPVRKSLAGVQAQITQTLRQLRMLFQMAQSRQSRGAVGGRNGGREDERTGGVAHIFRDHLAGRHVAAQRGQRLGKGSHIHIHLVLQAEIAGGAAASLAQNT